MNSPTEYELRDSVIRQNELRRFHQYEHMAVWFDLAGQNVVKPCADFKAQRLAACVKGACRRAALITLIAQSGQSAPRKQYSA